MYIYQSFTIVKNILEYHVFDYEEEWTIFLF